MLERYRQEALQLEERIRAETALKEEQFAQLEQDKEKLLQLQTKKYTNVVEDIRLMQAQIAKTQAQLQHTHDRHMALKRLHRNTQQSLKDKEGELEDLRVRASSKEETNPAAGSPMTSLLTSIVHSSATYLWGDADSPLCCRLSGTKRRSCAILGVGGVRCHCVSSFLTLEQISICRKGEAHRCNRKFGGQ